MRSAALVLGLALSPALADSPVRLVPADQALFSSPGLETLEPLLYRVQVNGQGRGDVVLMRLREGRLLLAKEDWLAWRLRAPGSSAYVFQGASYWPLDAAPGFTAEFDAAAQSAKLEFAPAAFEANTQSLAPSRFAEAQRPERLGGFFNYELAASRSQADGLPSSTPLNGQFETGLFHAWGLATSEWTALDLNQGGARRLLRLDSSLRRDDAQAMTTLQAGDAVGRAGLWGRAARFGGVQWGRNFGTQPGFITLPQPALSGEAALPSVLEVYVDGLRRQSLAVPPGPFTLENIPAVNGMGEVSVVVRDLLGREQLLSLPYVSGARQLRAGLHDYSYEAGLLREDFGRRSDAYGRFAATAQHQYGFSDALTGEARIELRARGGQSAGLGLIAATPFGLLSGAVAGSHEDGEAGALGLLGWQRSPRGGINLGARLLVTSEGFRQTGSAPGFAPPAHQFSANAGFGWARGVNLGLGFLSQQQRQTQSDTRALSLNLSARLGYGSLSLLASQRIEPSRDLNLSLSFSMPLQARSTSSFGLRSRQPQQGAASSASSLRVQRNAPEGEGWGYRAALLQDDRAAQGASGEGGVQLNARVGSYGAEASLREGSQNLRLSASGGLGFYGGQGFVSRRISNGFAVVETGAADIPLRLNGQLATHTDARGTALIPNLQPYQENRVQADLADLPLDVESAQGEQAAVPYFRSAVRVQLPVRRSASALLRLLDAQGAPLPAGTRVRLLASGQSFPVAREGQAYVTGLAPGDNRLQVETEDLRCAYTAALTADAGLQAQLGPLPCEALP